MFIIGENLSQLAKQHAMIEEIKDIDDFSIILRLDPNIYRLKKDIPADTEVIFNSTDMSEFYLGEYLKDGFLSIKPNECVLACSSRKINMPIGYIGFVQTKGSLARHFVTSHVCDSQIESGFSGKITLELVNFSPYCVRIPVYSAIAQVYIAKCSMKGAVKYTGRYKDSEIPTIPKQLVERLI